MPTKQKEGGNRCVLTLPLLTEPWQEHIIEKRFKIIEHLKNQLISIELRKLKKLQRTKAYKNLIKQIESVPKSERTVLCSLLSGYKIKYSRHTKVNLERDWLFLF